MAWDNFIDDLKMQVNIVDVIGREVELRKAGSSFKGLCPFHSEKTPSFMVNEERQIYNCFGCGEKGDVIKFVQTYYKLPFMEAVEKLAGEYGIKIPERRRNIPRVDYDKYYEINAKAARFFYNNLGTRNNRGLAYLKRRGLSKDTIVKFGLGYAPGGGTDLVDHLRAEKVSDEDMLKLGLANSGKNGLYDKFRDRVMFPIINTQDKVIGFGGRAIADVKPKYLNSPESEVFLKKNNLFGLNLTRTEISSADRAIIVEGYMDVISLYQSGVRNVAASLGTALTPNQAKLLCRYSKNIILSYDSDAAGISAALRGISVISEAGGKPKVLVVDDGKDPDEFVQKHGRDAFIRLADEAVPAADFRLRLAERGFDFSDDRDVLDYIEKTVPILRDLGPVEQDMYIRKLSERFGISAHAIQMAVATENRGTRRNVPSANRTRPRQYSPRGSGRRQQDPGSSVEARIEMALVILAINNPRYIDRYREDGIVFRSELASKVLSVCESLRDTRGPGQHGIDQEKITDALGPEDGEAFGKYLNSIQIGPDDEAFYAETRSSWTVNELRAEKSELLNELAIAEKYDSHSEIEELAARLIEIDSLISKEMSDNGGK